MLDSLKKFQSSQNHVIFQIANLTWKIPNLFLLFAMSNVDGDTLLPTEDTDPWMTDCSNYLEGFKHLRAVTYLANPRHSLENSITSLMVLKLLNWMLTFWHWGNICLVCAWKVRSTCSPLLINIFPPLNKWTLIWIYVWS